MSIPAQNNLKLYFDSIAAKRKKRFFSKYYWNEITQYCDYFSHEDSSVLEIGCGNGDLLANIEGAKKTGIDFSPEFINWAKEKHSNSNIEFKLMDANNIQLHETY